MPAVSEYLPESCGGRRQFLANGFRVLAGCACLPLFDLLTGCQEEEPARPHEPLTVPLALLPEGERTRMEYNGQPIEMIRTGSVVTARSLLCTHQGCKVNWHEDRQLYICPCHEGKYDHNGDVVYGMPRKPLALLQVDIQGETAVVSG